MISPLLTFAIVFFVIAIIAYALGARGMAVLRKQQECPQGDLGTSLASDDDVLAWYVA